MAGNENKSEFNQASVIDVYNLDEDRYQFSFYIYDREKEKLKNFMVLNDRLFAIFDHYVRCYKLDTGIVSNRKSNELWSLKKNQMCWKIFCRQNQEWLPKTCKRK